jgi:hypothetical protein
MFPEEEENNDNDPHREYERFTGTDTTVYKNDQLNVTITYKFGEYWDDSCYEAEWSDKGGNPIRVSADNLDHLYNEILGEAQGLYDAQIEWFYYMINDVLPK